MENGVGVQVQGRVVVYLDRGRGGAEAEDMSTRMYQRCVVGLGAMEPPAGVECASDVRVGVGVLWGNSVQVQVGRYYPPSSRVWGIDGERKGRPREICIRFGIDKGLRASATDRFPKSIQYLGWFISRV